MENIISRIDRIATENPDRIAYDYLGRTNTYGELKEKSDALASYLKASNLPEKAPLIVFGGQDFQMIATFLGIVKSGRAYIPVDVHSSEDRVKVIEEIARPAACIALSELPETGQEVPVISRERLDEIMAEEGKSVSEEDYVRGDDDFYVIFTSGTTGKPKGVRIAHDDLASFVDWMDRDFGLEKGQTALSQAPYSFDLSVMDLYPTLTNGGRLEVLPKETTDNFKQLFSRLPEMKVNTWVSTPSFADICLLSKEFDEKHLPDLKRFMFCGEELTHQTAQRLKERFPNAQVFNTYGPTEATVAVTQTEITDEVLENYQRLPIGVCKEDAKIILLDENGNEAEAGKAGEITIVGAGVSKGYLNNPEKTDQAFFEYEGKRAYRTGDLGRFDSNGQLMYMGRLDFQVKLHGYRIELEDVDQCLSHVSLVERAATVPRYDGNHKVSQLIAYVVLKNAESENDFKMTQAIKEELKETMMPYMMPQRFVYVETLPLTQNGKVDRKSLMKEVNR